MLIFNPDQATYGFPSLAGSKTASQRSAYSENDMRGNSLPVVFIKLIQGGRGCTLKVAFLMFRLNMPLARPRIIPFFIVCLIFWSPTGLHKQRRKRYPSQNGRPSQQSSLPADGVFLFGQRANAALLFPLRLGLTDM